MTIVGIPRGTKAPQTNDHANSSTKGLLPYSTRHAMTYAVATVGNYSIIQDHWPLVIRNLIVKK